MGSGAQAENLGSYVGTGADQVFKPGFKPKCLKVRSVAGEAVFHEGMPGVWKQTDAAVPAFLAAGAGVEFHEYGFTIKGSDALLNAIATKYYYEVY